QPAITTAARANRSEPDSSEPSVARQAELRAAYEANVAAGKPPYDKTRIRTRGELHWILRERDWSGDLLLPAGKQRPDLNGADFHSANLSGAILSSANVRGARLWDTNLSSAILSFTNLRGTDLSDANLSDADVNSANLSRADLSSANLSGAILCF